MATIVVDITVPSITLIKKTNQNLKKKSILKQLFDHSITSKRNREISPNFENFMHVLIKMDRSELKILLSYIK